MCLFDHAIMFENTVHRIRLRMINEAEHDIKRLDRLAHQLREDGFTVEAFATPVLEDNSGEVELRIKVYANAGKFRTLLNRIACMGYMLTGEPGECPRLRVMVEPPGGAREIFIERIDPAGVFDKLMGHVPAALREEPAHV